MELTAGAARFHLRTLPAEDFPRLPELEGTPPPCPPARWRRRSIASPGPPPATRCDRSSPASSSRPRVEAHHGRDRLLPAERQAHRARGAARRRIEANVPARALRELARIVGQDGGEEVGSSLARNQAVFRSGNVVLSSRLIEGQFPSWRQLIPESFEHEVRLPRTELLEVSRRISQLAQRNAPLRFAFAEGELTVAAETPGGGRRKGGDPGAVLRRAARDRLQPAVPNRGHRERRRASEVVIKLSSPLRPGLLEPVDGEDFSYLVMPIRLNV